MRARERYAFAGPAGHGDAELLALILGTGSAGRSARSIAVDLLERFGGLCGVSQAEVHQLCECPGMGLARSVRLHAGIQVGRRGLWDARQMRAPVKDAVSAHAILGPGLAALAWEELHALYLDRRHRPLALRMLTRGSDAFTVVEPRQIYRVAVAIGSASVILAHNHPSGDPEPSFQDHEVTRRVAAAGETLGIRLVDHLVVGRCRFESLAGRGTLGPWGSTRFSGTTDTQKTGY